MLKHKDNIYDQRVIRRNRLFVLVPTIALVVFVAILVWEIIRANESASTQTHLISLLGISPAASLAGVFGGLLLARSQFARSVRPAIGWSGGWEGTPASGQGTTAIGEPTWVVTVYNGGPGVGIVDDVGYRLHFCAEENPQDDWITFKDLPKRLKGGLSPGHDISIIQLGRGYPLASSTRPKDGYEILKIKEGALHQLAAVDMRIVIKDAVGDVHERHMVLLRGADDERVST